MSQNAQPATEKTQDVDNQKKAQAIIDETLKVFDISPEMAEKAKIMGLPIDKIALFTGMLDKRMENIENAVLKLAEGVKPAVDLSNQIAEARKQQTNTPQQPQSNPGGLAGLFQMAMPFIQQSGLLGGGSSGMDSFFIELGKKTLVDSMSLTNTINRNAMRKLSGAMLSEYEQEQKRLIDSFSGKKTEVTPKAVV